MSILEKPSSSSSSDRDVDPLLKDLNEKKQNFKRNVLSLAAELKELRGRLASQEQSYNKETLIRQEVELKANFMEMEIVTLQKKLEKRNQQIQASVSSAAEHIKDMNDIRSQLLAARASADANAASTQSAELLCCELIKELNEKNSNLKEQEDCVIRLVEQLQHLQKDLLERESSQKQLKDTVLRIENDIMETFKRTGEKKESTLRKILDEFSPKNLEKMNKLLDVEDEEIAKLKDEIKIMSTHWKLKTMDLESQLEKQRHTDQELKKRILKLEFCLQDARSQTRKLLRIGERRDMDIKELKDQLAAKQQSGYVAAEKQSSFWETSGFKIMVSMSMLILIVFSKR
ncbi:hypothetical protein HN51_014773 [Arachis hypogaea]|uniref:Uncharacterized protein n=2 Tax=Arachis hypogaea TaxID=3818 RepID=A0A445CN58_ARAHY|nr:uncharacterized protein DS421_6g177280 [Arachis hypogaea]RYR52350.1 hypothetical protein Ahy_A06g027283 isoform A [Arachis hypogaea]